MNREILIQALQSEGVVDDVILAALVKFEMWDIENRIIARIAHALDTAQRSDNMFEGQQGTLRKTINLRLRTSKAVSKKMAALAKASRVA